MVAAIVIPVMVSGSLCRNEHGTLTTVIRAAAAENPERTIAFLATATGIRRPVASGEERNHRVSRLVGCYLPSRASDQGRGSTAQNRTRERDWRGVGHAWDGEWKLDGWVARRP